MDLFTSIGFINEKKTKIKSNKDIDYDFALKSDYDNSEVNEIGWLDSDDGYEVTTYSLSKLGNEYVEKKIFPELGFHKQNVLTNLSDLKKQMNSTSLSNILSYVYGKYPEYADLSALLPFSVEEVTE